MREEVKKKFWIQVNSSEWEYIQEKKKLWIQVYSSEWENIQGEETTAAEGHGGNHSGDFFELQRPFIVLAGNLQHGEGLGENAQQTTDKVITKIFDELDVVELLPVKVGTFNHAHSYTMNK